MAYCSRVIFYALLPSGQGWLLLLCEPLHGVTCAAARAAAPPEHSLAPCVRCLSS